MVKIFLTNNEREIKMENTERKLSNEQMISFYKGKLDVLKSEQKRINEGVAPDYVQDKDLYGREIKRSEMIADDVKDIMIAIESLN